jgi:hypothetical protein
MTKIVSITSFLFNYITKSICYRQSNWIKYKINKKGWDVKVFGDIIKMTLMLLFENKIKIECYLIK